MATRFSEFQRLRAGHAISRDRFAVAIHELQADDPFSIILEYDGSFPQPWTRVEVLRNIAGVTAQPSREPGDRPYVAVSDEGDVFFLEEGGTKTEKIHGAGIYSEDADGSGAINGITCLNGAHHAFGNGGQVYRREEAGRWVRLPISDSQISRRGSFAFLEGTASGEKLTGGNVAAETWETPDAIEKEQLKAAAEGNFDRFQELAVEAERWAERQGIARVPIGVLLSGKNGAWDRIEINTEENLSAIYIESMDKVWIVGTGGLILKGNVTDGFRNISFHGDRDKNLVSITKFRDRMVIASDYALHWFDGHLLTPLKPKIDPFINKNVPTPLKVQAVEDMLFYFDYKHGVHLFDGESWEEIVIPPELLEREFRGMPPKD